MNKNGNCPDKMEPGKINHNEEGLDDVLAEARKEIETFFDFRLIEDGAFEMKLYFSKDMYVYVLDIKWKSLNNAVLKKQLRLTGDLPSIDEVIEAFKKQVVGDTFIKAFLDYDFLKRLNDEEKNNTEKKTS
tara:strand:- start:625 stop:1017 length:393 start_codon:yes stop_codon:yes gene_type:complete